MKEQRGRQRVRRRVRVRYIGPNGQPHTAFTADVSRNGFFVLSSQVVPPGTRLRFQIELPGGAQVELEGRAVWGKRPPPALAQVARGGFGVVLSRVPDAWRAYLGELETARPRAAGR